MKYFRIVLMPGLTLSLQTAAAVLMAYLAAGTAENPTFGWEVCFAAAGIFSGIIAGGAVSDLLRAEGVRNSDMLSRLTGTFVGLLFAVLILLFLGARRFIRITCHTFGRCSERLLCCCFQRFVARRKLKLFPILHFISQKDVFFA